MEVFRQAWTYMRDGFYDDKFHGVDWDARANALRDTYRGCPDARRNAPAAESDGRRAQCVSYGSGARDWWRQCESSALVRPAGAPLRSSRTYESSGRLKVTEVIPLGPAAVTRQVNVDDYVTAIDGRAVNGSTNLDEVLCIPSDAAFAHGWRAMRPARGVKCSSSREHEHREEPPLS